MSQGKPASKITDDIAALAAYKPRKEAIQMILDGRIDDYLTWAKGAGFFAAYGRPMGDDDEVGLASRIPLDAALNIRIREFCRNLPRSSQVSKTGTLLLQSKKDIEYFEASPLEIAVRSRSKNAVDAVIKHLMSPEEVFRRGYQGNEIAGWTSDRYLMMLGYGDYYPFNLLVAGGGKLTIALLAILLGERDIADRLVRCGLSQHGSPYWSKLGTEVANEIDMLKGRPDWASSLKKHLGISPDNLEKAAKWLKLKGSLCGYLEEMFSKQPQGEQRAEVFEMLKQGCPIGYWPLAQATEQNDLEMLKSLFEAGGNPNIHYKTGVSMLARINSSKLSPEALQLWLDYGANPTHGMESESPYGDGGNPSALLEWVYEGKLDLVRQAVEKAAGPVPLSYERSGKTYAPLLDTAIGNDHFELVRWMVEEKGVSPDSFNNYGERCKDNAEGKIKAWLHGRKEAGTFDSVMRQGEEKPKKRGP